MANRSPTRIRAGSRRHQDQLLMRLPTGRRVLSVLSAPAVLLLLQAIIFPMPAGVYVEGLTLGLLGALVSVGMCLIYRTNRIINFAQSALGLVPTVVAVDLMLYSGWSFVEAGLIGLVLS